MNVNMKMTKNAEKRKKPGGQEKNLPAGGFLRE